MAVAATRVSVGTTATQLDGNLYGNSAILIRNRGSAPIYVGPASVTTATGFELAAGEYVTVDIDGHDAGLYGITASGTVACHVLQVN